MTSEDELMGTRYCPGKFPEQTGSGLYAVFLKEHSSLHDCEIEDESRLLYIGKSESSIEARKHCSYPSSSASTLRRSLGAILKQKLKLKAFPRGLKKEASPRDIQNYRFDEKGEIALSEWMNDNLEFSYLLLNSDIKSSESRRIKKFNPPLNLTLSKNTSKEKLGKLRKICREEASQWINIKKKTPRELGYRMPAEWEPHEATWLAWPHNPEDWPGKFQAIPWLYAEIVRLLAQHEHVHILVEDAKAELRVIGILERAGVNLDRVILHEWPTNRSWTRDSGPIFIRNTEGKVALTNWRFNAWAKYSDWPLDNQVPARVAELLALPAWEPSVPNENSTKCVLEGGSIDTNGAGVLLTTEECLLSEVQQRNPGVSCEQLEQAFHDYLGIDQVIWLDRGIVGDDTHGHIDDIARFVGPATIVTAVEPNTSDPNHAPLAENLRRLKAARTLDGKQFDLVELPLPRPVIFRGQRLPASYANFYIANDLVLVPTFHDPNDRVALNILAELFPTREVIGIHSVDLVWGLGTLHCMTQQQPAAVASVLK